MRTLTFILLAVLTITACAQKSSVEKFIKKQKKVDGISLQEIDFKSEDFTAKFQAEGKEVEELLSQLEEVKILSIDSTASQLTVDSFISNAKNSLDGDEYTVLVKVRSDDNEDVGFYANQQENGIISELVVLVGENNTATMVYVKGQLDMSGLLSSELFTSMLGGKKDKGCH